MYSDTHAHLGMLSKERGIDLVPLFAELAARNTKFVLDIGTKADDLAERIDICQSAISSLKSAEDKAKCNQMIYYSAGIWPSIEATLDYQSQINILKSSVAANIKSCKLCAVGEFGFDHHYTDREQYEVEQINQKYDKTYFEEKERALFYEQAQLAKCYNLPILIHTRDAAQLTISAIKESGYYNGLIHCYSYGIKEAKQFLDLGFYIALGGALTYTKKSHQDEASALIRYIPLDRLLLETDAPYLAPVPHRGECNTPLLIEHTYKYIAAILSITPDLLSTVIDQNISALFKTNAFN